MMQGPTHLKAGSPMSFYDAGKARALIQVSIYVYLSVQEL